MTHSTTIRQALSDIRWDADQARETSYIAAQEAAREANQNKARVFALSVAAVTARYAFAPNYDLFRFAADGSCTQAAMTLTEGDDSLTVVAKIEDGAAEWFITDASRLHFAAAVYIAATQQRIENNRRAN